MGFFDRVMDRVSSNVRLTQLSWMTQPDQIIAFCRGVSAAERAALIKGIEGQFRWQSVALIARAILPSSAYGAYVSDEALGMAIGGQVDGALDLMRMENPATPQY